MRVSLRFDETDIECNNYCQQSKISYVNNYMRLLILILNRNLFPDNLVDAAFTSVRNKLLCILKNLGGRDNFLRGPAKGGGGGGNKN